ncbi:3-dehydroquinate synthase [Bacillus suaedaesalsae]|uniref:3-dehydroquinate synthase n=1 Tax=Bacillus suaedaesalsae TaxID=2810349 RepID=A0ABS2DN09_9BACI|nr:3-dehydroquinate synthase [Bacillus suaedaesalsae]MBM6619862.1 3-dehydroquinate synthase [Bacillus suaedaesalsae]
MNELLIQTNSKEYPLIIGENLFLQKDILLRAIGEKPTSILVITDDHISSLYLQRVVHALDEISPIFTKVIRSGEASKSFDMYYECQTFALAKGLDRKSLIIALGGGVIGDLAGFVAATFMRGIRFIQIPTTILAHDSAVGGKVAINHPLGKNTIGAFHQPEAVLYDTTFLKTLPPEEKRSGFAEIIKESLILEKNFYQWLKTSVPTLDSLHGSILQEALLKGMRVKATIVSQDERETGIRAYLNFGHTLGHALESVLGYGKISHGDAVAIGMIFAMKVSEKQLNVTLPIREMQKWFNDIGFPLFPKGLSAHDILESMKKDKKVVRGKVRMNLMKEIGALAIEEVDDELLLTLLKQECEEVNV